MVFAIKMAPSLLNLSTAHFLIDHRHSNALSGNVRVFSPFFSFHLRPEVFINFNKFLVKNVKKLLLNYIIRGHVLDKKNG